VRRVAKEHNSKMKSNRHGRYHQQSIAPTTFIVYKVADALIFVIAEYIKTFIRECTLILSQITYTLITMILHLFYKPGHYETNVTHRGKSLEQSKRIASPLGPKPKLNLYAAAKTRFNHLRTRSSLTPTLTKYIPKFSKTNSFPDLELLSVDQAINDKHKKQKEKQLTDDGDRLNKVLDRTINVSMLVPPSPAADPQQIEEIQKKELQTDIDTDELSDETTNTNDENTQTQEEDMPHSSILHYLFSWILSAFMWCIMLVWYVPSLFKAPKHKYHSSVRNDRVHLYEKQATGLLQDISVAYFEYIDAITHSVRLLIRFEFRKYFKQLMYAFSLFKPSSFLSEEGVDDRAIGQIILDEGYPYESYPAETQDGYILQLDRIPNKNSKKVVYFQHGILDSAFAWVGAGSAHSLALRTYNQQNVDVFLGNFRGYGMSNYHQKTTDSYDKSKSSYWDYSFNEHAFYDVRAFVTKIIEIKKKELNCSEEEIEIISVAHSMGAGSILAYLSQSGRTQQQHYLKKTILLAPAGNHVQIPFTANLFIFFAMPIIRRVVSYIGVTSRRKKLILAKLSQDLNNHPALLAFWSVIVSQFMLGGVPAESPFQLIHNLPYQSFNGTSVRVIDHFIQLARTGKFQAYDYGSAEKNRAYYSQNVPWDLSDYSYITPMIPVHILMGKDDRVIPGENIQTHIDNLRKYHGTSYVHVHKFKNVGHLELTLGTSDDVINYVLKEVKNI
jgi:pimeloyl-ACP methyl ester carboxylesterase